jgi:hypothetical protein
MSPGYLLWRDLIRLTQLISIKSCARYIFYHHCGFHGSFGGLPDREYAVILHQDRRAGSDGADDLLSDFIPPNLCISSYRDWPTAAQAVA